MGEALAKGLVVGLFFGIISLIAFGIRWIRYSAREKLIDEEKKHQFLKQKFTHLIDTKEGKKTITEILVSQPYKKTKPWKVYKTLKWGTWPINDNEESKEIFSILENEIEDFEEYIKFNTKK